MPANPRARVVAGNQRLNKVVRRNAGERGGFLAQRLQPIRNGFGGTETCIVEIVAPAEALGPAVPEPAMEAERREVERGQPAEQCAFFRLTDEMLAIVETHDQGRVEQHAHPPNSSLSSDGRNSGAS